MVGNSLAFIILIFLALIFAYSIFLILKDQDRGHRLNSCGLDEYWDVEKMQKAINDMKKELGYPIEE